MYSKQPEIMRAYQRDEEYKQMLRFLIIEALETMIHYRTLSKFDSEIRMGSDLLYYLLTSMRGKQTLGEEYCSIIPVFKKSMQFPSKIRRTIYILLKVLGPYFMNRLLKSLEQRLNEVISRQNDTFKELNSQDKSFKTILINNLMNLLPSAYNAFVMQFNQLYLALFFIWGKYYDLTKQVMSIRFKYVPGQEAEHQISYMNPGRLIMLQFVIQGISFFIKIAKTIHQSHKTHLKQQQKLKANQWNQPIDYNPQEDDLQNIDDNQINGKNVVGEVDQENEADQCSLCYGTRINTTATICGHLFCWDCIHTSLKIKQECPQCREQCPPQKLVLVYNL
ncbi:peroxisome biogenesis factor 10 [Stylonychia lemnae]|uniref:RING-type E3 ubiquitin transferase n=1 Tax=Stylonychia lemnae TaxID=5949 RepID=A0A078AWZ9_STYLE|nr:peroxisome biogenesis factor 10 [Stylonychia lemnae]|eukprot:CDW86965.1 peroxisome biogenesis factor 10 [Stylonychia lemnae]